MSFFQHRTGFSPTLTIAAATSLVSARSAIVATFGLGLVLAVQYAWEMLVGLHRSDVDGWTVPSMVGLALLASALALHLARRPEPLPARWFVPVALLIGVAIRVAYYLMVDPAWVSDFARYWRVATELAAADHYAVTDVYGQRALPYLVPLAEWFGNSRDVVKLSNIALLSVVQVLGYDILRRCHGHSAAQCFTVLWIASPEPLYSAMIPSHDLVAAGQVAIATWLLALAVTGTRGGWRWLFHAGPLALILVALELQRGIGVIVIASLLATGITGTLVNLRFPGVLRGGATQVQRLLIIAMLVVPLYAICMSGASRIGLAMPKAAADAAMLRYTTAHATSLSDGSYAWMKAFHDALTVDLAADPQAFSDLRQSLVLSDFVEDPAGRLENASDRLVRLYYLGGSIYFYSAGVADHSAQTALAMRAYNNAFAILFALLALAALYRLLTRRGHPVVIGFLLVMIAAITLSLVLIAENQPRYLYVVWLVGAFCIGAGLARSDEHSGEEHGSSVRWHRSLVRVPVTIGVLVLQAGGVVMLLVAAAWALLLPYDVPSGRIIAHWALSAQPPPGRDIADDWVAQFADPLSDVVVDRTSRRRVAPKKFGTLSLTLQLPNSPAVGDRVNASRRVCAGDAGRNDLAFFVYTPYKNLKRRGSFELELSIDDDPRWRLDLPHAARPVPVRVSDIIAPGKCAEVTFTLRSNVAIARDSWRRASRVEIYFPRLVDEAP